VEHEVVGKCSVFLLLTNIQAVVLTTDVECNMFSPLLLSVCVHIFRELQHLRSRLVDLTRDLEELGVTQEQLKECVSPVDMKTMNQKVWLLWQGQGDQDHHLAVLCHQLEEKLGLRTMFDNR
jgi:hypothetical protein